jgi:nicotinamide phosphoribosyltransferase
MHNLILNTDSYKASHWVQYPPKTEYVYSYIESRGGVFDRTVFFGLQMFIKQYLLKPITRENIDEAEDIFTKHGEPFNREGWEHILYNHRGYLPLIIRAVPEGFVVNNHNVLATIENTDPKCYWLTSYMESAILRAIWYPSTVATLSWHCKKLIKEYINKTSDNPEQIDFKLHDFGSRGVSSYESAGIGGLAHLTNFKGTDTVSALKYAREFYGSDMAAFSIPAAEHSTITSWGKEFEKEAYNNMLSHFLSKGKMVAVVSDSYDLWNAVDIVKNSGGTLIVRPDSGDPLVVPIQTIIRLSKTFGFTINSKGYRVLHDSVRVIQGDGITYESLPIILKNLEMAGFAIDNLTFGMGGGLLQQCNRDTLKFAMKTSNVTIDGVDKEVFKDPITDSGKKSKSGKFSLISQGNKNFETLKVFNHWENWLHTAYKHYGPGIPEVRINSLEDVRNNTQYFLGMAINDGDK